MLSVKIAEEGADVPYSIWEMRDQHFALWDEAQVTISTFDVNFQIIIAAERGDNTDGWAGFDDFHMLQIQEQCDIRPPEAVPHLPSLGDCIFQRSLCQWTAVAATSPNEFEWKRITGNNTNDEQEKPSTDHHGDPYGKKET